MKISNKLKFVWFGASCVVLCVCMIDVTTKCLFRLVVLNRLVHFVVVEYLCNVFPVVNNG